MNISEMLSLLEINGKFVSKRCTENYLKKNGFLEFIISNTPKDFTTIGEKLQFLKHGGGYCEVCGTRTNRDVSGNGFAKYCKDHFHEPKKNKPAHNKKEVNHDVVEMYKTMTILDIAKQLGNVSNVTVKKWLEEAGVEFREHSETQKMKAKPGILRPRIIIDRSELRKMYVDEKMPIEIIKDVYQCSSETIRRFLIQEGIERNNRTSDIEWVIQEILKKYDINFIKNDRQQIKPLEIDFFLPDYQIGIECNGLVTHSYTAGKKNKNYHFTKYQKSKERGIRLFQFWWNDIIEREEIIESMLVNALKLTPNKLDARKGEVKEISWKELGDFCRSNHIQGAPGKNSKGRGLFISNRLVAVVGFTEYKGITTITRFCSVLFTNVRGAFQKLIKDLRGELVTYSSNDISRGELYLQSGFTLVNETKQDMWYTDYKTRFNRQRFMKAKQKELLENFDSDKTEIENMIQNGFDVIYGSGSKTWKMIR